MIQQVDDKKSLQNQISKKMELRPNQNTFPDESPVGRGPVVGNTKIGELSDIVQQLLEDQRKLKSKLNERDEIIADLSKDRNTKRKNTQEKEKRAKSLKLTQNSKKIGSADNKSLAARRLREKYTQEKERITAIESKIQKARKRKADYTKAISKNLKGNVKNRPSSDFNPKLYKKNTKNNDLEVERIGKKI